MNYNQDINYKPRANQRVYLTFYLRMYSEKQFTGFLIDVSEEGLMLMSEVQMEQSHEYDFQLKLPSYIDWKEKISEEKYITFKAR